MFAGALVRTVKGVSGKITVPGIGMVVGEFQTWTLIRREDNGLGNPTWDLHAVFRYHNDLLLKNDMLKKRIVCQLSQDKKVEICDWESIEVEDERLIAKGVTQCPQT